MRHHLLYCLTAASLCSTALATTPPSAEPEVYQGASSSALTPTLKSGIVGLTASLSISLPAPSAAELDALNPNADPPVIGFGRPLPTADQRIAGSQLAWSSAPGGGQMAVFSVSSPGASALRLQLNMADLPAGVEFRFFAPFGPATVSGPLTSGEAGMGDGVWSPSVDGDVLAVEVFLPADLSPDQFSIEVPQLSHLAANPGNPTNLQKSLDDIGGSTACQIDVQCQTVPDSARDSVAKMVITDSGGNSFFCTGTLLADTDPSTQIPYFLTAHHCGVSDAAAAANIEFYWFFERAACGGAAPDSVTRTAGGGTPLSSAQRELGNDHALLRLNQAPPNGVILSGWSAARAALNSAVVGVHHPNGDIKKVSRGNVVSYASTSPDLNNPALFFTINDGVGPYLGITWQSGVTEGGSSGSAVWLENSNGSPGGPYVVGALLGGGSSCANPQAGDVYGSFDLTYKATRAWLDGSTDYTTIWQDQSRSGQGLQLLQNGNTIQGAWYTYDGNSQPMWLTFVANIANGAASAPLLRFTGPALGSPWSNPSFQEAGQANLSFSSPTTVSFSYSVDGVSDTLNLTPFTSLAAGGYSGVWWDTATPGQGVQLIQSGAQLSGAWYLYDANGTGRWYTFVGELANGNSLNTNLLSFTGPALGQPWDTNQVQFTNGGQISLSATSPTTIQMSYAIGNVQGNLNLVPFNP